MDSHESVYCLTGNVKVGKTTLFHRITSDKKTEVEIPGTPVTYFKGRIKNTSSILIDPPGIGSVFVKNEDEQISKIFFSVRKSIASFKC